MTSVRRIVLDVLKPHEPSMVEYAEAIEPLEGIDGMNLTLLEIDEEVQNIKITLEGKDLDFERITSEIEELGGSVHSVDQIACGEELVEEVSTPQD